MRALRRRARPRRSDAVRPAPGLHEPDPARAGAGLVRRRRRRRPGRRPRPGGRARCPGRRRRPAPGHARRGPPGQRRPRRSSAARPSPGASPRAARARRRPHADDVVPVVLVPATRLATSPRAGCCPRRCRTPTPPPAPAGRRCSSRRSATARTCCSPPPRTGCTRATARPAMPGTVALLDALRARGVAAVVSGAGPTVLVLAGPPVTARPTRTTPCRDAVGGDDGRVAGADARGSTAPAPSSSACPADRAPTPTRRDGRRPCRPSPTARHVRAGECGRRAWTVETSVLEWRRPPGPRLST